MANGSRIGDVGKMGEVSFPRWLFGTPQIWVLFWIISNYTDQ